MRRPIVIANWKMHTTAAEAVVLARRTSQVAEQVDDIDVVILPPAIWLPTIAEALHHRPKSLSFGVQNFYPAEAGAFTGEIGLGMLAGLARYALVGHSERRTLLHESDEFLNEKLHAALRAGLHPILCVGELTKVMLKARLRGRPTVLERQSDIVRQLRQALHGITERHVERLLVCYEPLWAISSVSNAEHVPGAHVQAVLEQLRQTLADQFGQATSQRIRLLYGGSVNENTIDEYVKQPDIDGVLVGGASLDIRRLQPIIEAIAGRAEHLNHRTRASETS